ncbi:MAG: hypothetical protein JO254_11980 [Pseudolabrys sp.]|nr:hypothetical protein [Pseudolabrys sp.]
MTKTFAIALALTGAVWLGASASANAATSKIDGISNANAQTATIADDLSARRRRHWRARYYPAPTYYGYYGPTYYERPYVRPASPFFWGWGGYW